MIMLKIMMKDQTNTDKMNTELIIYIAQVYKVGIMK